MSTYRKIAFLVLRLVSVVWIANGVNDVIHSQSDWLLSSFDPQFTGYSISSLLRDVAALVALSVPVFLWVCANRLAAWMVKPVETDA